MPWMEQNRMSLRQAFCMVAAESPWSVSAFCRRFGISRKTGYKWLARYDAMGAAGLVDQSRRP